MPDSRVFPHIKPLMARAMNIQHLFVLGLLLVLYVISTFNYLIFHSFIEIFTIVVASCIFVVGWNARKYLDNNFFLTAGIAYLFISIIGIAHQLSYKGMGVFPVAGADLSTQLWIAGRYLEAFTMLAAVATIFIKIDYRKIIAGYAIITAFLFALIFYWKAFPACFIEGSGLTPFKIYSEYAIAGIMAASLLLLTVQRNVFEPRVFRMLAASFVLTILSGLMFTQYSSVYDVFNFLGHAFRLLAFYLIYLAIVQTGLNTPYDIIFRNLKRSEAKLSDANAQLKRDIVDLNRAEDELTEAKNQAELYVDLMGHDINNLNQIGVASLELALETGQMDSETRALVERSLAAFNGSSNLIGNVKKLQRAKAKAPDQGLIDVGDVLASVAKNYREVHPEATISYAHSPGHRVKGNELLYDVFSNLVGNAIKHTEGQVEIKIDIADAVENCRDVYRIAVEDNGTGISDERKKDIFGRFKRGQTKAKGSGLGLYLVRTIVESYGGRVWVEDRVAGDHKKGSRFIVILPAAW